MYLLVISTYFASACSNILEYENIEPCASYKGLEPARVWNSVEGIVRYDNIRMEHFIVARFPNDENLTVLRTCNLPAEFVQDLANIRFFGNEYVPEFQEMINEDENVAKIALFEITYIERTRR